MGKAETVKVITYVEIALFILDMIFILLGVLFAAALEDLILQQVEYQDRGKVKDMMRAMFIVFLIVALIVELVGLILLIFLFKGQQQRSPGKLKVWFFIETVGTTLGIIRALSLLVKFPGLFGWQVPNILFLVYRVWALVVVKGYINELQNPQQPPFQAVAYSNA